ncbi:hypothetical protein LSCM1_07569 [Leishmania martiniquensis]|uniref:Uncharacterized protein n=1 Tax=Leishmania martiniquensis TaxID=1580590 RepID=A0A836H658_9TRYP|nr:hypothetical protein LSCM1_07569 [Leishmania martiniquensis]
MLRGLSLAPQQRGVRDPHELPREVKNALLGVPIAHAPPDYGSAGGSGADPVLASSPLLSRGTGHTQKCSPSERTQPSLMSRLFRTAKHRYYTRLTGQVPVFDYDGNLTTQQRGVHTFRFRSLSLFYFFRSQPWMALITYSVMIYVIIVLLIAAVYYAWGTACGAVMNVVSAIYFTVVSLAANGGYMGEDGATMTDATHMCYRGRTAIVMVCSYVNIVFVGLVAALVVSKAECTGKLGHRVVFSDFCTLASVPGRADQWRLVFRIANVDNHIPLARGTLRLFCVTAEPLKEYHMRQKQHQVLQYSYAGKALTRSTWGSIPQLLPEAELDGGCGRRQQERMALPTTEVGQGRGDARARKRRAKGCNHRYRAPAPPVSHGSPTSGSREDADALAHALRRSQGRRKQKQQLHQSNSGGGANEASSPGGHLGRCSGGSLGLQQSQGAAYAEGESHRSSSSGSSRSLSDASSGSGTSTLSTSTGKASSPHQRGSVVEKTLSANCSVGSQEKIRLDAGPPPVEARSAPDATAAGKRSILCVGIADSAIAVPSRSHVPKEAGGITMERMHLCVQEMRWTCAGETYLDRGESGQLSLWYPAEILHIIDERSPLRRFLELPHVAASLCSGSSSAEVPSRSMCRVTTPQRRFQIVAVFDATDMESGSAITAKRTYTTEDIVAHYKFSDRLVHVHPESNEVMLDFHYFNALLPVNLLEPSTTDSDM